MSFEEDFDLFFDINEIEIDESDRDFLSSDFDFSDTQSNAENVIKNSDILTDNPFSFKSKRNNTLDGSTTCLNSIECDLDYEDNTVESEHFCDFKEVILDGNSEEHSNAEENSCAYSKIDNARVEDNNFENTESQNNDLRRKRNAFLTSLSILLVIIVSIFGVKVYKNIKAEQARLAEFNKEELDLKLVIDTVDECGGDDYQLNWKEIASVLGVLFDNRPDSITKEDIENVSSMFLDIQSDKVNTLDSVVNTLDIKNKEKDRIYDYLHDLSEYGYTPEKLTQDSEQMKFINSIKPGAFDSYKKTGILPSIIIAQAILESNWGASNLCKEANNLFGIKADSSWDGETVVFETKEFHDTYINDKFRKYETLSDSIVDHSEFLKQNQRYTVGGVFEAKTYKTQALALQDSGYSTAQDEDGNKIYASMLETLIRQYNLQLYDWEVKNS